MSASSFETLVYDLEDGVATVTLNRPEKLNALTWDMTRELLAVFDATDADDAVKAVIVTGAGRAFCAGADLSIASDELWSDRYADVAHDERTPDGVPRDWGGKITLRIFNSLKPVIAAVNGAAVGVGVTMQLPMDIRLASNDARFGFVFARRGLVPEAASGWFLPRLVGLPTALEWCYTGRLVSAQEAHAARLVRSLHSPSDLLPTARALAREISEHTAPVSIALTRRLLWRMACADHPMSAHQADSRAIYMRGQTRDVQEGIAAFLQKRPPVFPERVSRDMPEIFPQWTEPPFE